MRILIPLHGFISWNGGVDLIRLIVTGLRAVRAEHGVELVFALPRPDHAESASAAALRAMAHEICATDRVVACENSARGVNHAAVEANANVVFPSILPIRTNHVRKVGYIYDFQHRDLPQFFSASERAERDEQFVEIVTRSNAMFATSRFVAEAVHRLLGVPNELIVVMPFTPYLDPAWLATDIEAAQQHHRSGGRYAMICNHFWMHKDHAVALRAFADVIADPQYADLQLVMTGETTDFRDPNYFRTITDLIASLGLGERCRILGLIPKQDQIALLRGAELLLQPTRYEGGPGGGSSFEAAGLGIPAILSDIAVNLEARGDGMYYFKVGDADDLAQRMREVLAAPRTRLDVETLQQRARQRLRVLGDTLVAFLRRIAS